MGFFAGLIALVLGAIALRYLHQHVLDARMRRKEFEIVIERMGWELHPAARISRPLMLRRRADWDEIATKRLEVVQEFFGTYVFADGFVYVVPEDADRDIRDRVAALRRRGMRVAR